MVFRGLGSCALGLPLLIPIRSGEEATWGGLAGEATVVDYVITRTYYPFLHPSLTF